MSLEVQQCKVTPVIDLGTPPIGMEIIMGGDKFAFEKQGIDGLLHKTDCFGEFEPIQDHADIYGDGSMVSLRQAA